MAPTPKSITEQKAYEELRDLTDESPVTKKIFEQEVSIPLYPGMTQEQIEYVIAVVNSYS